MLVHFIFSFQDLQNSFSWDPPFALYSGLENTHLQVKDNTFKAVNMDIFFLHKICQLLVCKMSCSQFDTNLAPIPWTSGLQLCNLTTATLQLWDSNTGIFLWKFAEFVRTPLFTEHFRWLLLMVRNDEFFS